MRRGLASVFFFVAAIAAALAAAGWWLQRVAFDTATSGELAAVVLEDRAIRDEIVTLASDAAAATLGLSPTDLRARVDGIAQTAAGADLMRDIVADSHARLVGLREEPVQITGPQLAEIVRDQRAAVLPPTTVPVEEVGVLSTIRTVVTLLIGFIAHPLKADATFGIGIFCIVAGLAVVVLGFVVPAFLFPVLDDSTWGAIIPAVAGHYMPFVVVAAAILVIAGLTLMLAAAAARRRRAWSAPIAINRYADQRRWS
jgi:hypothetical protein